MFNTQNSLFLAKWVAAVTVTTLLAAMGAFFSMWSVGTWVEQLWGEPAGFIVALTLFGALISLGVGLGQAIILRSYDIPFTRWLGQTVAAGTIGMGIGSTIMLSLFNMETIPEYIVGIFIALSLGLPIGIVQARLLKQFSPQASLWIPICIVTLFVSFAVGLPLGGEGREVLSVGTVSLLVALLSGMGMVWLSKREDTAVTA